MSDWSMEPAAAVWTPCNFQLANWTMEPAAVWAPGLPVESESTQIFGSCFQAPFPSSSGGQLMIEYAAATQNDPIDKKAAQEYEADFHNMETRIHDSPIHVFEKAAHEFEVDINMMAKKIHRYPAIIRALGEWYTVPTMVSIGPYHHGGDHLKQAEKVKHVAAYHCIRDSGHSVQEMYDAVVSVADDARSLYDKDVVAGIGGDDFLPMMFYDACFLVQYMLYITLSDSDSYGMDQSLLSFFNINDDDIYHDIFLLENQLPWVVVEAIMRFRPVPLEDFVARLKGGLQDRKGPEQKPFIFDYSYEPPHLLGLLRYYIVGRSNTKPRPLDQTESISVSVSAVELAEIGIRLTAKKTTELIHMGVRKNGTIFAELYLPPLSLDISRACLLVNMAALELCTTPNFQGDADDEDSAVCSYLLLFGMIVDREEDVQELRTKHLLQGGGGLTNKEALEFFTSLQGLRLGSRYVRVMEEIENYKVKRPVRTQVHKFVYKNMKTIAMAFSGIGALVGILGTLKSLKVH